MPVCRTHHDGLSAGATPHRPPLLAPARGPPLDPQRDFLLDQSLGPDPAGVEFVPEYVFDQSTPDDWELAPEPESD